MQPAGTLMTWRSWSTIPTADTTAPARTEVVSLIKANGQVQDTLTYTAAASNQAILTAVATGPRSRCADSSGSERAGSLRGTPPVQSDPDSTGRIVQKSDASARSVR